MLEDWELLTVLSNGHLNNANIIAFAARVIDCRDQVSVDKHPPATAAPD